MALRRIRLELARTAEFPEGSAQHGYDIVAPLTDDGYLDEAEWRREREACTVHRFWAGEDDQYGRLVHHRGDRWAFRYDESGEEGGSRSSASTGTASSPANTYRSPSTTA